jgi:putative transposase
MARATIARLAVARPDPPPDTPPGLGRAKGYDADEVRALLEEFGLTAHRRARGEEAQALKQEAGFKARRGVVARTPSGRNRFRRGLIRWDKKARNYLGFLH